MDCTGSTQWEVSVGHAPFIHLDLFSNRIVCVSRPHFNRKLREAFKDGVSVADPKQEETAAKRSKSSDCIVENLGETDPSVLDGMGNMEDLWRDDCPIWVIVEPHSGTSPPQWTISITSITSSAPFKVEMRSTPRRKRGSVTMS